jgi:serine/threonine-protein kinase
MAEVYRAVTHGPAGFQRQFVIKRIRKEKAASKDFVDMFINEARISALLEHPNIVQVYDFGQVDGDYFLAMEYLRGRNLLTVGRRVRSLTREIAPELAAYVARETARGLHYAHTLTNAGKSLGIVHRDVSPSNIMLLRTGGVKLLDFGIARATMKLRANTPIGGLIKGKLSYLSPEQVRGHQVDGRSDVFSLGVVLWECLTGVRLFYNPNDLETMRNVLHRQVPKPSEMRHGLAESLDQIVMKALDRDLDRRYPDAGAMAADLEEYLREVRFSSETLVQLLEELFADEDSARELPLPGEGSSSAIEIKIGTTGRPASSGDSLQPPPRLDGSGADDAENGYATVSSIHKLSEAAARNRRRRVRQALAAGAVLLAGMLFAALRIPGRWPDMLRSAALPMATPPAANAPPPAAAAPAPAPHPHPGSPPPPSEVLSPPGPPGARSRPFRPDAEDPKPAQADSDSARPSRPSGNGAVASLSVDPVKGRKALARGLQALSSGEYMRAVQELESACQASPRDPEALRALAEAEFELARYAVR